MKKYAFIIGANKGSLQYAESDALMLTKALENYYYFPPINLNLSARELTNYLEDFLYNEELSTEDSLLFFFAGHSKVDHDLSDLRLAINSSVINNYNTWIDGVKLIRILQRCKANTLVILDSCESSALLKTSSLNCNNFALLAAAKSYQKVHEIYENDVKGGILSHYLHKAITKKPIEVFNRGFYIEPYNFMQWVNTQIKTLKWSGKVNKINIYSGLNDQVFKILSLEEEMSDEAKAVLQKNDNFLHLQKKEKFEENNLKNLLNEIVETRKDWERSSPMRRKELERKIVALKERLEQEIRKFKKTKLEKSKLEFSTNLYDFLIEYNFTPQKNNFWQIKEDNPIFAFIVKSEANYKNHREQKWIWKNVLPYYLKDKKNTGNQDHSITFFEAPVEDIYGMYSWFKKNLLNKETPPISKTKEKLTSDIKSLAYKIIDKLKCENIIIPIYLSEENPNFYLFDDFIQFIWQPLCEFICLDYTHSKNHLILIVLDNDTNYSNYCTTNQEHSIRQNYLLRLENVEKANSDILLEWEIRGGVYDGFFMKYSNQTEFKHCDLIRTELRNPLTDILPSCGTPEVLLDIVCKKLRPDLEDYGLEKVINHVNQQNQYE